jgi:prepilin-type N-terminal cleavage/methylation domain-containing protein/prepilin-type processing-associated H-X9-DG protein
MKIHVAHQPRSALTLIEVLLVVAILAVIFAMIESAVPVDTMRKAQRINCVNNLKQTGLAYGLWSQDHNGKYPMDVSVTNGGAMELMGGADAWRTFQVLSNELSTPKILICPSDEERQPAATNFSANLKGKISYFINPAASDVDPQFIVSGDDNFVIGGKPVKPGLLEISSNTPVVWSGARHKFSGNFLMGDGSVQSVNNSMLTNWTSSTNILRLAIP